MALLDKIKSRGNDQSAEAGASRGLLSVFKKQAEPAAKNEKAYDPCVPSRSSTASGRRPKAAPRGRCR
ncbi:hypothetical protein [Chitinimonas koreensis]|uniref:hypothetical protein n=1 Tax=Chitinimonas koreensis TaxID=356302 RepID=UPI002240C810|nr:hypothetical protein [Chitinimonas koreensis]